MRSSVERALLSILLPILATSATGCLSYRPGDLAAVTAASHYDRAGTVYMVRGLYGVFSTGLDTLRSQLEADGVRALVYDDIQAGALADTLIEQYRDVPDAEPIVLVGHSLGADDVIGIARRLDKAGLKVALLITLDPVYPDPVSPNVRRAINYYRSTGDIDLLPAFRGVPITADPRIHSLENIDIRYDRPDLMEKGTNHFNIDKNQKVHRQVIAQILAACPPRRQWVARHSDGTRGARHVPRSRSAAQTLSILVKD